MTQTSISPILAQDLTALEGVLDATGLFPPELLHDMATPALEGDGAALWLVARQSDRAVGFAYTVPEEFADGTWNMLALAVHPAAQGQGVGAALVTATQARLRALNQRILIVDTSGTDAFAPVHRFYGRCGFEKEARIRDFWAAGDDKLTFWKAL